jgi:hypothetical protein
LLKNYRQDTIVSFLIEHGSLTYAQLDTIMVFQAGTKLGEMVSLRDRKRVTKGAFLRTLRQGQRNVQGAIYTLILLEYLGLTDSKQLLGLGRIGELISKVRDSSPTAESINKLLFALEEFACDFTAKKESLKNERL